MPAPLLPPAAKWLVLAALVALVVIALVIGPKVFVAGAAGALLGLVVGNQLGDETASGTDSETDPDTQSVA